MLTTLMVYPCFETEVYVALSHLERKGFKRKLLQALFLTSCIDFTLIGALGMIL